MSKPEDPQDTVPPQAPSATGEPGHSPAPAAGDARGHAQAGTTQAGAAQASTAGEGEGAAGESAAAGRPYPVPPPVVPEQTLPPAMWGTIAFLVSEGAFFAALIVAYITFLNRDTTGPTPGEVLSLSLVLGTTACLLSSSFTIHAAEKALRRGTIGGFKRWWAATIALGVIFLAGTAYEWAGLIRDDGLTISTNLFGTTFYTLVGFHAFHVTAGVIAMLTILGLAMRNQITARHEGAVGPVSLYWHFVDGVWIVVFLVVYVIGR